MTALKAEAPTRRETAVVVQGRTLIIEAGPRVLTMRLKGRRYRYCLRMQEARERRRLR